MRKWYLSIIILCLCGFILLTISCVEQSKYDDLQGSYDRLKEDYDNLQEEKDELETQLSILQVNEPAIPEFFTTYTDKTGFFNISYPNNWISIETSAMKDTADIAQEIRDGDLAKATTVFGSCLPPTNTPSVSINVNTTQGMSNNLYYEMQKTAEQLQQVLLSQYQLISLYETIIGGRYAIVTECIADYTGNGSVHYVYLSTVNNQTLWTVSCGADISEFDIYVSDIYLIINSFRLN